MFAFPPFITQFLSASKQAPAPERREDYLYGVSHGPVFGELDVNRLQNYHPNYALSAGDAFITKNDTLWFVLNADTKRDDIRYLTVDFNPNKRGPVQYDLNFSEIRAPICGFQNLQIGLIPRADVPFDDFTRGFRPLGNRSEAQIKDIARSTHCTTGFLSSILEQSASINYVYENRDTGLWLNARPTEDRIEEFQAAPLAECERMRNGGAYPEAPKLDDHITLDFQSIGAADHYEADSHMLWCLSKTDIRHPSERLLDSYRTPFVCKIWAGSDTHLSPQSYTELKTALILLNTMLTLEPTLRAQSVPVAALA